MSMLTLMGSLYTSLGHTNVKSLVFKFRRTSDMKNIGSGDPSMECLRGWRSYSNNPTHYNSVLKALLISSRYNDAILA